MKLTDKDREQMQELTREIEARLFEIRAIMNRTFGTDMAYQARELLGEIVVLKISKKDGSDGDPIFVEVDVTDGKGNCGVYKDPPGVCEPKPCIL